MYCIRVLREKGFIIQNFCEIFIDWMRMNNINGEKRDDNWCWILENECSFEMNLLVMNWVLIILKWYFWLSFCKGLIFAYLFCSILLFIYIVSKSIKEFFSTKFKFKSKIEIEASC